MPTRCQPPVRTFVDGETFDTQAAVDKLNENNQMIQVKFGALTWDDFSTANATTVTFNGSIDARGHLVSNIKQSVKVFNVLEDTRTLKEIIDNEASPTVFIPPNTTLNLATKIQFKTDTHIIGSGPSSVIRMSSTTDRAAQDAASAGFNLLEVTAGIKNWSIRNLTLAGRRGHGKTSGTALHIFNARSTDGEVENVFFGPGPGAVSAANLRSAWHNPVRILGSRGVRFTNCQFRAASNTAIWANRTNYANSKIQDIEIVECAVEGNSARGISMSGGSGVLVKRSFIGDSGEENVRLHVVQFPILADNDIYGGSTAADRADRSVVLHGSGTTDCNAYVIHGNKFVDRSPKTLDRHLSIGAQCSRGVLVGNFFNQTSQDSGQILNNSTVIAQVDNLVHEGGYGSVSNKDRASVIRASETTRWQTWKDMQYADVKPAVISGTKGPYGEIDVIASYQRSYVGDFSNFKDDYILGSGGVNSKINFLTETLTTLVLVQEEIRLFGVVIQASVFEEQEIIKIVGREKYTVNIAGGFVPTPPAPGADRIGTSDVIRKFGNIGAALTPERFFAQTTHLDTEVRAVIANWNLAPGHSGSNITSTPIVPATDHSPASLFPGVAGASAVVGTTGMNNNVLSAVMVSGGARASSGTFFDIVSNSMSVVSFAAGETVIVGKPTWVSVKV